MQVGRLGIGSLVAGGVLGVAAMVGVGLGVQQLTASAQTPSPTATVGPKQQAATEYLEKLAANLGVSVDALKAANVTTLNQLIDEAQAAGRLTAEQAAKAKERVAASGGAHLGPHFGGFAGRHGKPGPGGPHPEGMRDGLGGILGPVASFLGIEQRALMQELMSGKSLVQVAQDHGKSRDDLKAALSAQFGGMLDQMIDRSFQMPRGPMGGEVRPAPSTAPGT